MNENEISALFTLIDDPDEEVFGAVSQRIVGYGKGIIPSLEHLWENTPSEGIQERIEMIIHRLHFTDLQSDVRNWASAGHHDLLVGALLVAKFQYPDLSTVPVLDAVDKIRRNIWLELNHYLTGLEQVRIVSGILYSYYGLKGTEVSYDAVNDFLINKVVESKRGNQLGNGLLYLTLCEMLDIPVRALNIPKQFVLGYFRNDPSGVHADDPGRGIEFFIDPSNGMAFTHEDIGRYFKRISVPPVDAYFRPMPNKRVIQHLMEETARCFSDEKTAYKGSELEDLSRLLD